MPKLWSHVRRDALLAYADRNSIAYLYGANGETGSSDLVNRLWNMYPDHFAQYVTSKGYTKEQLIAHVNGKRCYDCSSFICAIVQGNIYPNLTITSDMNSTTLRAHFAVTRSVTEATAGSILWKNGHVGIDIGSGLAIDCACEFVDLRLQANSAAGFVEGGELDCIDYTGTSAY